MDLNFVSQNVFTLGEKKDSYCVLFLVCENRYMFIILFWFLHRGFGEGERADKCAEGAL